MSSIGTRVWICLAFVSLALQAFAQPTPAENGVRSPSPATSIKAYDWSAHPSSPAAIAAGSNTITLPSCPAGMDLTNLNKRLQGLAGWSVRFPDHGTDEVAVITGGTCRPGMSNGTVILNAANTHSAGYSITSASSGLQEAINDACYRAPGGDKDPLTFGGAFKIEPQTAIEVYATIVLSCTNQTVDLTGGMLHSHVSNAPTIYVGVPGKNTLWVNGVTLINPTGQPEIPGNTGAFLEVNAMNTRVYKVELMYPYNIRTASFGTIVRVDDDQAFLLDGLDNSNLLGGGLTPCDANGCPSAITTGSGYAVGWLKHLNLIMGCKANGISWLTGNGLQVSDSVVQAYAQFGIRTEAAYGTGVNVFENVYQEVGNCKNPLGTGSAGIICQSGMCVIHEGNSSGSSSLPQYACTTSGKVLTYYYAVANYADGHASEPYLAGLSKTDGTGTCTVKFPKFGFGNLGYDLLAQPATGLTAPPASKGNFLRQGGLNPERICTGSEMNAVCTVTDDVAKASSLYNVIADRGAVLGFWPSPAVLTGNMNPNALGTWNKIEIDRYYLGSVTSALGSGATSVYARWCNTLAGGNAYSDTIVNCEGQAAAANLPTSAIAANSCGAVQTVNFPLPLVFGSSIIHWSFASSPESVAGWGNGSLKLNVYPVYPKSAGLIVCNTTSAKITPGAVRVNMSVENP